MGAGAGAFVGAGVGAFVGLAVGFGVCAGETVCSAAADAVGAGAETPLPVSGRKNQTSSSNSTTGKIFFSFIKRQPPTYHYL